MQHLHIVSIAPVLLVMGCASRWKIAIEVKVY